MKFNTLYKKTNTGAIQFWTIEVQHLSGPGPLRGVIGGRIITTYGQVGTDSPQTTHDDITKGKNVGRSNETTPYEQAVAEAKARHEKQIKKGYVESIQAAEAGENELPGIIPMTAHTYDDHGHKISWPAIVQPKLDGIRCIAVIANGKVELFSRTRKPITSMKHIEAALLRSFGSSSVIFDGELYNHSLKNDFEQIVSAVRKQEYTPEADQVEYHIYDVLFLDDEDRPADSRQAALDSMEVPLPIRRVPTTFVTNEQMLFDRHDKFVEEGYEGAMVREASSPYEHKRSYGLLKVKKFHDAEFEIVDVKEGRGKLAGHGIFTCKTDYGQLFDCKMAGETEKLKEFWEYRYQYVGKLLTVQYQGFSNTNSVPRFPVGLRIREPE